ncbi:MAG: hypothetical protein Q8K36_06000 [Alphaproteobacteria bacterium]|nr:hypothetical protein [Alphaproteobacteria bacterium]
MDKVQEDFLLHYTAPWPGDPDKAYPILRGYLRLDDHLISVPDCLSILMRNCDMADTESLFLHGFSWLRDLRCLNENAVRRIVRKFLGQWMLHHEKFKIPAKDREKHIVVTAERITNWIAYYDFFGASADDAFIHRFFDRLHQQVMQLMRHQKKIKNAHTQFFLYKALIMYHLSMKKKPMDHTWMNSLIAAAEKVLHGDGSHISQDPLIHFYMIKDLLDLRLLLRSAGLEDGERITPLLQKMMPVLRFLRLGNGKIVHYSCPRYRHLSQMYDRPSSQFIDMILSVSDIRSRPPAKLGDMGFEKIHSQSSQIVLNVSLKQDYFQKFYGPGTGILDFEWNHADHRIVSRGDIVMQTTQDEWLYCKAGNDAPLVMHTHRKMKDGQAFLEGDFESIVKKHHNFVLKDNESYVFHHNRQLFLGEDQGDFRGQDRFLLSSDALCAIRFVLPPDLKASVLKSSKLFAALIKNNADDGDIQSTPLRAKHHHVKLWRFYCQNIQELSVHWDEDLHQHALIALVRLKANKSQTIKWAFKNAS